MDFKLKKSDLNFKVYTSETEPTTPGIENDIVIITSVPMSNWILSTDKPSGTPRTDGDVCIRYSVTGNTFNALKNDSMMIATISAYQFVDGAWVDVTAKSCQNGEWVDLMKRIYIFEEGVGEKATFTITKDNQATINVAKDGIEWGYQEGATANWVVSYCTQYDVTNIDTICVEATVTTFTNTGRGLAVILDDANFNKSNQIPTHDAYTQFSADGVRKVYELDVRSYTGNQYIGLMGAARATIHNIYMLTRGGI